MVDTGLPRFGTPPVQEVVVGLQFTKLSAIKLLDLGRLWDRLRPLYSRYEELPALESNFELFGMGGVFPNFQFQIGPTFDLPRLWFLDSDSKDLLQFQTDRVVGNWRKMTADVTYPGFERIESRLFRDYEIVKQFVADVGVDVSPLESAINQCEVSYVNHFPASSLSNIHRLGAICMNWNDEEMKWLHEPEDVTFQVRRLILDASGEPYARMIIAAGPSLSFAGERSIGLSITVRGRPLGGNLPAAKSFISMAHEAIVRQFDLMTSNEMHVQWGKQ